MNLKGYQWMGKYYPQSKVEVSGLLARHYDRLLDLVTFGRNRLFIEQAIGLMNIKTDDRIIDFATEKGDRLLFCVVLRPVSSENQPVPFFDPFSTPFFDGEFARTG